MPFLLSISLASCGRGGRGGSEDATTSNSPTGTTNTATAPPAINQTSQGGGRDNARNQQPEKELGGLGSFIGRGVDARFNHPDGIAADTEGNLYVADTGSSTIRKITAAGVVTVLAGSIDKQAGYADGGGAAAQFAVPDGIAVDTAGNLYVADTGNNTIRKITPAGVVTTLAGTAGPAGFVDGIGPTARFQGPRGITMDTAGNLYVADMDNNTIRKITAAGAVTTLAGAAIVPGSIHGNGVGSIDGNGAAARFNHPHGIAVDTAGNLYVADSSNHTIRKITAAGLVTTLAGAANQDGNVDGNGAAARFNQPHGIALDTVGNLYVADWRNSSIRKITTAGLVTTLAGTANQDGHVDGMGAAARFKYPEGIAVDAAGNLYVADTGNNTIRKITAAGLVTTVAGSVR